ncbi:MAG: hypothetical protein H2B00_02955 [Nitrosopumilaceae archaeon]|uniref:Uncharacterized protein n=2 Tax=Candidatus Nitrosomaritimum aestuariumsis TaxID=3342354 RepID=A0AC60W9D8_9ARCH|nr:hypothetical protein [Nitrosopumilaceae archaeon]MBA4459490.1 hypothetical protein [Nitrosopumilaceae archaeon]MBA4461455.1 hypothetical protein [Nitrosopumilaceae archaeon]MBA4463580.1 hypothetical protein [Nitrosopumilaceae archaeon]
MEEQQHNAQIEKIANMLTEDNVSVDEQDSQNLQKYKDQTISDCDVSEDDAIKIVYEALLYLKLKNSSGVDPIQKGDQFGAGFS